jgi:hypothetical protein
VGMDDVEGLVREAEVEHVADLKAEVLELSGLGERAGLGEDGWLDVEADHEALGNQSSQADGDGARTASDIEHPGVWSEMG